MENNSENKTVCGWTDIIAISAEMNHYVGLKSDGTVVAAALDDYSNELNVGSWTDIIAIAAGSDYTTGLKSNGTIVIAGGCDIDEDVCYDYDD